MKFETYRFDEVTINFDRMRIPLSSKQRSERQGEYRYYGAQGVIDYIDDFIFDGTYLLIAEDGENLKSKKQNIAQLANGKFWVNNHAHIVQTNELCDLYYLYYLINSMDLSGYITGSAQPKLSQANLNAVTLQLPPIDEQRKVAAILGTLDDKIELNNKINENLERQAQAIFKSWFLDYLPFYSIKPTSWKFSTLGEATKMSAGGDKPKSISSIKSTEYPYPIYSNGLDNEGLYGYTNEAKIFDESVTVSARGTIGFVCLRYIPYVPIVRLVTLIPDENMISAKYLYLYLKQLHISGTGTTQQQLTVPDFCKTEILIPDKTTMDKFTNLISPMFNRIWTNKEENIKLASLRDNLLPKLMSGEINVSDIQLYYFNSCL